MDISSGYFYYFSADLELAGLPTRCEFVESLKVDNGRESILIRCENFIKEFGGNLIVVVPRNPKESLLDSFSDEDCIFVYTFEGKYFNSENIFVDKKMTPVDIGGIVKSKEKLLEWNQ